MTSTYPYFETGDVITTKSIDEFTRTTRFSVHTFIDPVPDPLDAIIEVDVPWCEKHVLVSKASIDLLGCTFRVVGYSYSSADVGMFMLEKGTGNVYKRLVPFDEIIATVSESCIDSLIRLRIGWRQVTISENEFPKAGFHSDRMVWEDMVLDMRSENKNRTFIDDRAFNFNFLDEYECVFTDPPKPQPASKDDIDSLYFGDSKE